MPLPEFRGHMPKRRFADAPVRCGEALEGCGAWCCRHLLVLVAREDLDDGLETEPGFLDLLRKEAGGACAYLDEDGGCGVREERPLDCRVFTCEGRDRPGLLRPSRHGAKARAGARPVASTPCAHCGEAAGYVVRFVWREHRIRCAACGGSFLPRVIEGAPLRLRVDPVRRTEGERRARRGETREYLGDLDGALEDFTAAMRLEPDVIGHALGRLCAAIRSGREEESRATFADARARDEPRAWLARGLALDLERRHEEAALALRRAEALGLAPAGLHWGLARAARAAGRPEEAVERLAQAVALAGSDVRIVQDLIDLAHEGAPGARVRGSGRKRSSRFATIWRIGSAPLVA